jgi:hypothetical protein
MSTTRPDAHRWHAAKGPGGRRSAAWRLLAVPLALLLVLLCAGRGASPSARADDMVSTAFTTAGCTPWTVPAMVSSVQIQAVGAAGAIGAGFDYLGGGGRGDGVAATLTGLTAGESLMVCVASGGGGGGGGGTRYAGGSGGGASGVSLGSDFLTPVLIAAGGGGGGGSSCDACDGGSGGNAGSPNGTDGEKAPRSYGPWIAHGGGGGTASSGGAPGSGWRDPVSPQVAQIQPPPAAGSLPRDGSSGAGLNPSGPGAGGAGGNDNPGITGEGGGGGAGYYGGGGGAAAIPDNGLRSGGGGGGGGSDFCTNGPMPTLGGTETVSDCTVTAGAGTNHAAGSANGSAKVVLTYANPSAP